MQECVVQSTCLEIAQHQHQLLRKHQLIAYLTYQPVIIKVTHQVQVTHIGGGTFEWCGGTVYADPGLLPLKDLCDETELTLENGGIEVLYFDSSGELPITNLTEIEKLGLLVPIELDNGTTIGL